jgi:beta-phosphoglucomutase-like phosphatase (HAD superfamily)
MTDPVPAQACVFDMDGVLVDSGRWHRAAWGALLKEIGAQPGRPDFWRLTIGRPAEEAVPLLLGRRVSEREALRLARRKRDLYVELAKNGTAAVAGAQGFVADVAFNRVPRAVGTSAGRHEANRLLTEVGLYAHFDVIVSGDDVMAGKPDPEVYVLAARRLGAAPEACLVFEDSLVGIEAACRAGMRVIGVSTAYTDAELCAAGAERVIPSFEGLSWTSVARP